MVYTATMSKIVVIPICLGHNFTHERNDQDIVYKSRTDNESNMTYYFLAQYMTQSTTLTNYSLCTCCHKTDIPRLQCIIFKE